MKHELKRELGNELPPIQLTVGAWPSIIEALLKNKGKFQPVYYNYPDTGRRMGEFFVHMLVRGDETFVQFQGFDNRFVEETFVEKSEDLEPVQPGIYRVRLT